MMAKFRAGFGVLDAIQRLDLPLTSDKIYVLADTPADLERVRRSGGRGTGEKRHSQDS